MATEVNIIDRQWYGLLQKPKTFTKNIAAFALEELKVAKYRPILSVVLANDNLLGDLNKRYRNIDKATNVLSFSYYEEISHGCCLGEVFLSIDRLEHEASEMGIEVFDHFVHMLIHGILHILGYDHEKPEDEKKMQALEAELLNKRGIANPYLVVKQNPSGSM